MAIEQSDIAQFRSLVGAWNGVGSVDFVIFGSEIGFQTNIT